MTERKPNITIKSLARALDVWENEGGAVKKYKLSSHDIENCIPQDDGLLFMYLGAAVMMQWNGLPKSIQRNIFANAASVGTKEGMQPLKHEIACLIHDYKNEI